MWQFSIFGTILLLSTALSWSVAAVALYRGENRTARWLVALMTACGFWSFSLAMRISSSDFLWELTWFRLIWIGILIVPLCWFAFILHFIGYEHWFTRRRVSLLVASLLLIYGLVLTNDSHHLITTQFEQNTIAGLHVYYALPAPLYYVNVLYLYGLVLAGMALLLRTIWRTPASERLPYVVVFLTALTPSIGNVLQLVFRLSKLVDITTVLFAVCGVLYLWVIFRHQLLEIGSIARNKVIDSLPDGVIVVDRLLRVVDLNPSAYRFIYPMQERSMLIGNSIRDVLPAWMQQMWTLSPVPTVLKQTLKANIDGQAGFVTVQLYPIYKELSSEVLGWVLNLRDVTVEQQAQAEREQLREQQLEVRLEKERMNLLTTFIRNAAQEFGTPLTIMTSSAFLLERIVDRDKRIKKARIIQEQVQRTINLVDTLLKMVNLEGEPIKRWSPVNVGLLVNNVCQNALQMKEERAALDWQQPPDILRVFGNAEQLMDVVSQVMDNAYRFTPPDGKITVRVYTLEQKVRICIQDTGIGISAADLPHIFEMFWRKDIAHPDASFGLGLAVAQKIVQLHEGEIEVHSEVGYGSQFCIILPEWVESFVEKSV